MPGPLPAGDYEADAFGFQQGNDAKLHFDLLWRRTGAADQTIASADSTFSTTDDGGVPKGDFGAVFQGAAVPARCDDLLVLRITFVSGSAPFLEIFSDLSIP